MLPHLLGDESAIVQQIHDLGFSYYVAPTAKGDTICTGNFLYGQFQSPLVPQGLREPQLWAVKAPGQQGKTAQRLSLSAPLDEW